MPGTLHVQGDHHYHDGNIQMTNGVNARERHYYKKAQREGKTQFERFKASEGELSGSDDWKGLFSRFIKNVGWMEKLSHASILGSATSSSIDNFALDDDNPIGSQRASGAAILMGLASYAFSNLGLSSRLRRAAYERRLFQVSADKARLQDKYERQQERLKDKYELKLERLEDKYERKSKEEALENLIKQALAKVKSDKEDLETEKEGALEKLETDKEQALEKLKSDKARELENLELSRDKFDLVSLTTQSLLLGNALYGTNNGQQELQDPVSGNRVV